MSLVGHRLSCARTAHELWGPLAALCVAGHVGIHIDRTLALEQVPEPLRYVGEGRALGKVAVEVNVD